MKVVGCWIPLFAALLVLVGHLAPLLMIGDNVESFSGEERAAAAASLRAARSSFSGFPSGLFVLALRVEEVRAETPRVAEYCAQSLGWGGPSPDSLKALGPRGQRASEGLVQAYTVFGLPWGMVLVDVCDGRWHGAGRLPGGLSDGPSRILRGLAPW